MRVMLIVWQGARRCLSCSGQRTNQRYQIRHRSGTIGDKLDRYQLLGARQDAALLLELRPPRRLRKTEGPRPEAITKKGKRRRGREEGRTRLPFLKRNTRKDRRGRDSFKDRSLRFYGTT